MEVILASLLQPKVIWLSKSFELVPQSLTKTKKVICTLSPLLFQTVNDLFCPKVIKIVFFWCKKSTFLANRPIKPCSYIRLSFDLFKQIFPLGLQNSCRNLSGSFTLVPQQEDITVRYSTFLNFFIFGHMPHTEQYLFRL